MGESARDEDQWFQSALSHFGSCTCAGVVNVRSLGWKRKQALNWALRTPLEKVWKCRCLRFPHIVHLDLICMNYDQKKGRKLNWEFYSPPQILWKQRCNECWLRHAIHHWKDPFEGYKILHLYSKKILDLKKIWTSKVLKQQESEFWTLWKS
jgi:hypothetical protein